MASRNYKEEINALMEEMAGKKAFSAKAMKTFLSLKKITDRQGKEIIDLEKKVERKIEKYEELYEKKQEVEDLFRSAKAKVFKYKKEAKAVRKTKRELAVTLLEKDLAAEQGRTLFAKECLSIMFKNPVYQESHSKSITENDTKGSGYNNKNKTENVSKTKSVRSDEENS